MSEFPIPLLIQFSQYLEEFFSGLNDCSLLGLFSLKLQVPADDVFDEEKFRNVLEKFSSSLNDIIQILQHEEEEWEDIEEMSEEESEDDAEIQEEEPPEEQMYESEDEDESEVNINDEDRKSVTNLPVIPMESTGCKTEEVEQLGQSLFPTTELPIAGFPVVQEQEEMMVNVEKAATAPEIPEKEVKVDLSTLPGGDSQDKNDQSVEESEAAVKVEAEEPKKQTLTSDDKNKPEAVINDKDPESIVNLPIAPVENTGSSKEADEHKVPATNDALTVQKQDEIAVKDEEAVVARKTADKGVQVDSSTFPKSNSQDKDDQCKSVEVSETAVKVEVEEPTQQTLTNEDESKLKAMIDDKDSKDPKNIADKDSKDHKTIADKNSKDSKITTNKDSKDSKTTTDKDSKTIANLSENTGRSNKENEVQEKVLTMTNAPVVQKQNEVAVKIEEASAAHQTPEKEAKVNLSTVPESSSQDKNEKSKSDEEPETAVKVAIEEPKMQTLTSEDESEPEAVISDEDPKNTVHLPITPVKNPGDKGKNEPQDKVLATTGALVVQEQDEIAVATVARETAENEVEATVSNLIGENDRDKYKDECKADRKSEAEVELEKPKGHMFISEDENKLQTAISDKDSTISNKDPEISDKDPAISDKDLAISYKDPEISDKNLEISDKDPEISDKDPTISDKDPEISANFPVTPVETGAGDN